MTRKLLIALPLLLLCFGTVFSQDKLGQLKSWDGKTTQEVNGNGKVTADFFALPEVRLPRTNRAGPSGPALFGKDIVKESDLAKSTHGAVAL